MIGNIGPDCGVLNEDWSKFDPPTELSHWRTGSKSKIQAETFADGYLYSEYENLHEYSFMLGYYVHLLTDIAFADFISEKKKHDKNYERLNTDKKFIWTIKKDWYDLDRLYFRDNPNSIFHKIFKEVKRFPDYLPYYPKGAVSRQVGYITDFYFKDADNLDREFVYLTLDEMDRFLDKIIPDIEIKLNEKIQG